MIVFSFFFFESVWMYGRIFTQYYCNFIPQNQSVCVCVYVCLLNTLMISCPDAVKGLDNFCHLKPYIYL